MISSGNKTLSLEDITNRVTEAEILSFYLGINKIPCLINSPLRKDNHPSFAIHTTNGVNIRFRDYSTGESGGTFNLLIKMWGCSFYEVLNRVYNDIPKFKNNITINKSSPCEIHTNESHYSNSKLECKVRNWKDYDEEYWNSYGITIEWLKYADVYPISHKIIIKDNKRYVLPADKYAYAYVERKEGNITLKIYQPFNKKGFKWSNKHDASVLSLWTKVPEYGDIICICSSLKDSLCLWANTGIPAIAIQGEGYSISDTAINELKRRYKHIFICLDNDEPGIKDAIKLAEETGFINIVLPNIYNGKDISDIYHNLKDKTEFKHIMLDLFNDKLKQ